MPDLKIIFDRNLILVSQMIHTGSYIFNNIPCNRISHFTNRVA